jgi:putative transposase
MSWLETEPMNEKVKFISAYLNNQSDTFISICARFNISCKTGYKYLKRYQEYGIDGLKELSRAPHHNAKRSPPFVEKSILDIKNRHPSWGSKKILNWLTQEKCKHRWPAKSTIDEILKRHGLVTPAKRKRRVAPYTQPFILCDSPNDSWSMDYKGQFMLGNKELCYPLTVTDNYSRYLLAVKGSKQISGKTTKQVLTELFHEYGLPRSIRSDNGSPFAGNGLAGLSSLAVWLIKLSIVPERIRAGHPEENGRHERMHLTLKKETANPPKWNQCQQQKCFDAFQTIFNEERPHEGIDFNRPAWLYSASKKSFPKKIPSIEYDSNFTNIRRIRTNGTMKWRCKEVFITETLVGESIAMMPHSDSEWILYFSFLPLGIFNEKTLKIRKMW